MKFFKHKHKWQTRAANKYGLCTYRVCLRCGDAEELSHSEWENGYEKHIYKPTSRIKFFDEDFEGYKK